MTDMPKKHPIIISIAGDLGSGKSLLTAALVEHFGAERYSTGNAQRKIAAAMGITTLELNKLAESDKSIDDKIDGVFKDLSHTKVNLVVDSRMAFHFLPMSYRIRLEVDPKVAARRIQGDKDRIGEGQDNSLEAVEAGILARKASERARFIEYYDVDIEDHGGYDLIVNTTGVAPEAIAKLVIDKVEAWARLEHAAEGAENNMSDLHNAFPVYIKAGVRAQPVWISPRQLFIDAQVMAKFVDGQEMGPDNEATHIVAKRLSGCTSSVGQGGVWLNHDRPVFSTGICPLIVENGAGLVSLALRTGQELVCVHIVAGDGVMPEVGARDVWQKYNDFKYIMDNKLN